jgi:hypothetical protein
LPFINFVGDAFAIAVSHNILFAADEFLDSIHKYDAKTGAVINFNFITGLNQPGGMALAEGSDLPELFLFVAISGNHMVGKYDANTGAVINASFITGLHEPAGLVVMPQPSQSQPPYLFVSNFGNNTVGKYDANTGKAINVTLFS